jgi:hypothetical protein
MHVGEAHIAEPRQGGGRRGLGRRGIDRSCRGFQHSGWIVLSRHFAQRRCRLAIVPGRGLDQRQLERASRAERLIPPQCEACRSRCSAASSAMVLDLRCLDDKAGFIGNLAGINLPEGTQHNRDYVLIGNAVIEPRLAAIHKALQKGDIGIRKIAVQLGVATGTVQRVKAEMAVTKERLLL